MFFNKKTNEPQMQRRVSSPNLAVPKTSEAFQQNAHAAINRENVVPKKSSMAVRQTPQQKMSTTPAAPVANNVATHRANIPTYGNPHKTMAPRDVREGRKLIVGREISLNGEINTCDHLVVEGTVRATIKGGQTLEIAPRGLFEGTVEIQEATIAGTFEGNIRVLDRLYVKSTGVIRGNVEYGEMEVEAGARIDGQIISMGGPSKASIHPANDESDIEPAEDAFVADDDIDQHADFAVQDQFALA